MHQPLGKDNHISTLTVTGYAILARKKFPPAGAACPRDFLTRSTGIQPLTLDAHITPYCLDNNVVTLVQTPDGCDLRENPFLYRTQYEMAQRLFTMSVRAYVEALSMLPAPAQPIFICGTGRSGSTLLARILATPDDMIVFDEPDIFTNMAQQQYHDTDLIRAVTTQFNMTGQRLIIKQRSFVTFMINRIVRALPDSRIVFLFRNPEDWIRSNMRILLRYPVPEWLVRRVLKPQLMPFLSQDVLDGHTPLEWGALLWVALMRHYQRLREQDYPILGVSYDELIAQPAVTVARICEFCDIPNITSLQLDAVMATDSQAGTLIAKNRAKQVTLSPEQRAQIRRITDAFHFVEDN